MFETINSVRSVSLIVGLYHHDDSHPGYYRAVYGLAFTALIMVSMGNVLCTLTRTEAQEMLRQDQKSDQQQARQLVEFMAACAESPEIF